VTEKLKVNVKKRKRSDEASAQEPREELWASKKRAAKHSETFQL
jgi:hypothetical protein